MLLDTAGIASSLPQGGILMLYFLYGGREGRREGQGGWMDGCVVGGWIRTGREGGIEERTEKGRMVEWIAPQSLVEFQ